MKSSENITEIIKALAKAQCELKPAETDSTNPRFKSSYNSLTSIWEAIRDPLSDNGLVAIQDITTGDRSVEVTTRILHTSGEWMEFGPLKIFTKDNDAQSFGSAITYGKKYSLCAALGVVRENDDDGNRASLNTQKVALAEPLKRITKDEVEMIEELLIENFDLRGSVLEKLKISSFHQLLAKDLPRVVGGIRIKMQEMEGTDENN